MTNDNVILLVKTRKTSFMSFSMSKYNKKLKGYIYPDKICSPKLCLYCIFIIFPLASNNQTDVEHLKFLKHICHF